MTPQERIDRSRERRRNVLERIELSESGTTDCAIARFGGLRSSV